MIPGKFAYTVDASRLRLITAIYCGMGGSGRRYLRSGNYYFSEPNGVYHETPDGAWDAFVRDTNAQVDEALRDMEVLRLKLHCCQQAFEAARAR